MTNARMYAETRQHRRRSIRDDTRRIATLLSRAGLQYEHALCSALAEGILSEAIERPGDSAISIVREVVSPAILDMDDMQRIARAAEGVQS